MIALIIEQNTCLQTVLAFILPTHVLNLLPIWSESTSIYLSFCLSLLVYRNVCPSCRGWGQNGIPQTKMSIGDGIMGHQELDIW